LGLVIAGGLFFGLTSDTRAQVNVTVGTPAGGAVTITPVNPYPYASAYRSVDSYGPLTGWSSLYPSLYGVDAPNPWPYTSRSGYLGYVPTTTTTYSSAYSGYAPTTTVYGTTSYDVFSPTLAGIGYPTYGYNVYGFGPYYGVYGTRGGFVGGLINRSLRW
jgi:hypothetical protein